MRAPLLSFTGCRHIPNSDRALSFLILGQSIRVECPDPGVAAMVAANFGAMAATGAGVPQLRYAITITESPRSFTIVRQGQPPLREADLGDLLFRLEKDITVELQKRRADLFFLHSAALEWQGRAILLAADSGSGKSTTAWALLHHGFRYLSDELGPVDPESLQVFAYPHALCLKQPAAAYPLPREAIDLGRTLHVPVAAMPGEAITGSLPLGAVFLVRHCPDSAKPVLRALGPAEAGARLYVTALNALAHPNRGLDAVVRIAEQAPCFDIATSELPATCAMIRSALEHA